MDAEFSNSAAEDHGNEMKAEAVERIQTLHIALLPGKVMARHTSQHYSAS